ncbi:MAG: RsmB/NOP family class I SAM-dependent RNA methyltransferase [Acetobacter sp.]|nr:RsmB/NOP family class I SAM-dependent RNA methyltransferase [Acetobacter sp.]
MKDASRVQAIIEVLGEVLKDSLPADVILDKYFKERRYIGSKDRRQIADNVWKIIRNRMSYTEALGANVTPRLLTAMGFINNDIDLLFNGEEYAPALLTKDEKEQLKRAASYDNWSEKAVYECPLWLLEKFNNRRLLEALNTTAAVDVRANLTSREKARDRLKKEGLFFSPTPFSPIGLRSEDRINLNNCMTYQDGEIEVMDEASQLISLLCRVKPHHKVIDYCAGAGGKSLAIGALMNNDGVVWAHDISQERLSRIKKRAERLDIINIKTIKDVIDTDYTRFIIDAPCSGSGTWRRSPDAKYRLTPERLASICQTQAEILEFGAAHTKIGGRLIYITCSVFAEENERQIETFLAKHPEFSPINHRELWKDTLDIALYPFESEKWLHFSPLNTKTDGFFFCALKKGEK